jgi:hypothetical protein
MVSTSMKEKKSSSWWYFVCSTINLGWLLIPTECAEDIINPAKGPKHKQAVEGYPSAFFFHCLPLAPSIFFL